jgi:transcriptional regulator with XRE-family HTH domain
MHCALLVREHSAYRPVMQLAYPAGMTNGSPRQTRRRENLRTLIEQNGGQAQVALEIGTPKSHLSAILAGRRGVGDALAQKIEQHFALPPGWLDSNDADVLSPDVAELLADINTLPPKQRDWVLMTLREAVKLARETVTENALERDTRAPSDQNIPSSSNRRRAA